MAEQRFLFDGADGSREATILRDEEPMYRLFAHGSNTLSDSELVSIVTGRPLNEARVLVQDGLPVFARRSWDIGGRYQARRNVAARIVASLELGRRVVMAEGQSDEIVSPEKLGPRLATQYGDAVQEHFGVVFLTTKSTVIVTRILSIGTLDHALVSPRDVVRLALEVHAAGVIVFHNHPSGLPSPSREDHDLTRKLNHATDLMGIDLVDHLIVAKRRYYSMKQHGDL